MAILATQTGAQPVLQQLPQPYSQANSQLYSQLYSQPGRLRIALWHTGLGRRGPGLFLQDIRREAPDILAAYDTLVALAPDVLILLDMDFDHDGMALAAFADALAGAGLDLPYRFAPRPNTGMATGVDMDGDGRLGTADDAQGWARFAGSGGIALLSRWPLDIGTLRDNSTYLWRDLPGTQLPMQGGQPFPNAAVFDIQRLASTGAWEIGVTAPGQRLTVMTWHAGPPAFGGAQARNRLRNAAENDFWPSGWTGRWAPRHKRPSCCWVTPIWTPRAAMATGPSSRGCWPIRPCRIRPPPRPCRPRACRRTQPPIGRMALARCASNIFCPRPI